MARDQLSAFEKALVDEGIAGTRLEDVARSIHQQESGKGKNTKTSNAGAVGQMQIVPRTFKAYNPGGNIKDPYDNAVGGLRYIKDLAGKAGEDVGLVAAGYYGGPKAMEKAKQGVAISDTKNPKAPNTLEYMQQVMSRTKPKEAGAVAQGSEKPSMFRSPVPHFIRSEAPNLGTGYNAALALMGMSDKDELEKAQETVAQAEEENSVADFGQAKTMLAGVQAPNAFAGQKPRMMAEGGFVVPVQRNIYRQEDRQYLDEQLANWNKYNAQANDYNTKLAAYQNSAPVKQYATAAEAYNSQLADYNKNQYEPYRAQVDAYNTKLAAFNASPEYTGYQQNVTDYNNALNQYQRDVYDPYKAQVDQYNVGLDAFKAGPYAEYDKARTAYNATVDAYNNAPVRTVASQVYYGGAPGGPGWLGPNRYTYYRATSAGDATAFLPGYEFVNTNPAVPWFGDIITKDVAKPGTFTAVEPTYNAPKPTAPTAFDRTAPTEVKFGEVVPTKPADFTMATPTAPAGFGEATPVQPSESINAVMARKQKADTIAAQDAEQRGIAINAANNPNQYNLAGFGSAGINAPTIALMAKGGEAKKSEHDSDAEKLFDDFLAAAKQYTPPVNLDFKLPPAQYVEGMGWVTPPPSVSGRVGTNFDVAGGNVRIGAQGMAMQTPDKKILTMPGMYDVGYNTQAGPGNLDISFQKEIKAMPGREKNYAINARYSIPFAEGGEVAPEPEKGSAKAMLKEVGRSTQYAPADLAGSPVDLINMGLKGVDAMTGTKLAQNMPVGGSEWLIDKARQLGLMDKPTGSTTENLTRMGMGVVSPTAGPRAMVAAGKAVKGTAKAALEDLSMAATGQGGSKVAQGVAKVTGLEPAFASRPKGGVSLGASSAADVPLTRIDEQLKNSIEGIDTNSEQGKAIAGFLDKKMRNYYQNQYGTADDPVFKAVMEGRMQPMADPRIVDRARAGDEKAITDMRRLYDASTNIQALGSRKILDELGKHPFEMEGDVRKLIKAQSPNESTTMVTGVGLEPKELANYPGMYGPKGFKDIVAEGESGKLLRLLNQTDLQPHVRQAVAKGEPIYGSTSGTNRMLPIGEIKDYLFTRTPAEIKNMGVVDAAVKSKQWHVKMAEARKNPEKFSRKELFNGTEQVLPLEKNTWVDVRTPDALSLEGNIMGHCSGGSNYCNAVAQDSMKIISLRDKKGLPHVTIQLDKTPEGFTRIAQIKGTGNNSPEKYFGEINAFLDDYSAKLGKNLTITERPSFVPPQWRDK